ncbi:MAG: BON domain-containing protein [Actinomycetota bacterium]|nr:BON domain-containing protein [Actinomycetota bacterium]
MSYPWSYPVERYYYGWYEDPLAPPPTDRDIKSMIVERLRQNPFTADEEITVDVKHDVVILNGEVGSTRAKRAAGDDAWDTPGVVDVSNQLSVSP